MSSRNGIARGSRAPRLRFVFERGVLDVAMAGFNQLVPGPGKRSHERERDDPVVEELQPRPEPVDRGQAPSLAVGDQRRRLITQVGGSRGLGG